MSTKTSLSKSNFFLFKFANYTIWVIFGPGRILNSARSEPKPFVRHLYLLENSSVKVICRCRMTSVETCVAW